MDFVSGGGWGMLRLHRSDNSKEFEAWRFKKWGIFKYCAQHVEQLLNVTVGHGLEWLDREFDSQNNQFF